MSLIDSHCHLTFEPLQADMDAVLERSRAAGVTRWITIGTDIEHSRAAVTAAQNRKDLWATVGVHPHEARHWDEGATRVLEELSAETKVVALGEMGLDFHYDFSTPAQQEKAFEAQLELATKKKLPVVVHTREAFDRTIAILKNHLANIPRVVLHCFTGSADQARAALAAGMYLSFTGVVTFKNAHAIREAAELVPLDRLMIETDCPYMSPEPVRKQRINEPANLVHTARFLANLKGLAWQPFVRAVQATTLDFFSLPEQE